MVESLFNFSNLQNWIQKHDAEKKAYEGFWMNLRTYKEEDSKEFNETFLEYNPEHLKVKIESVAIHFSNNYPNCDYNHVIITIPIIYKQKEIGYYKLLLDFDGKEDDDYFCVY